MNYHSMTIHQLETLARRAKQRNHRRATWYDMMGMIVEVVFDNSHPENGPEETVIRPDGTTK